MEIVKAFNNNDIGMEITILGTYEDPLFRASDIGTILEMSNIRATIKDFDKTQKVVNSIDTLGGEQEVSFLTEKGLYEVLFRSRKPIAKQFKDWVCEVIKEIRLTGQYKLKKEVEELKQVIQEKEEEIEFTITECEKNLLKDQTIQIKDKQLQEKDEDIKDMKNKINNTNYKNELNLSNEEKIKMIMWFTKELSLTE